MSDLSTNSATNLTQLIKNINTKVYDIPLEYLQLCSSLWFTAPASHLPWLVSWIPVAWLWFDLLLPIWMQPQIRQSSSNDWSTRDIVVDKELKCTGVTKVPPWRFEDGGDWRVAMMIFLVVVHLVVGNVTGADKTSELNVKRDPNRENMIPTWSSLIQVIE